MDGTKCILQLRGVRPFFSDKYDITRHKRYKELSDYKDFFLMQSQQFGKDAAYVVVDSNGNVAAEDTTIGFTDEVIRQIRAYMERQNAYRAMPAGKAAPHLENWQKSFENGEYLRAAEMAEEQNYSMIDGRNPEQYASEGTCSPETNQ